MSKKSDKKLLRRRLRAQIASYGGYPPDFIYIHFLDRAREKGLLNYGIRILQRYGFNISDILNIFFEEDESRYYYGTMNKIIEGYLLEDIKNIYGNTTNFNDWYNQVVLSQV